MIKCIKPLERCKDSNIFVQLLLKYNESLNTLLVSQTLDALKQSKQYQNNDYNNYTHVDRVVWPCWKCIRSHSRTMIQLTIAHWHADSIKSIHNEIINYNGINIFCHLIICKVIEAFKIIYHIIIIVMSMHSFQHFNTFISSLIQSCLQKKLAFQMCPSNDEL